MHDVMRFEFRYRYTYFLKRAGNFTLCRSDFGCSSPIPLGLRSGGDASTSILLLFRAAIRFGRSGVRIIIDEVGFALGNDVFFLLRISGKRVLPDEIMDEITADCRFAKLV